MAYEIAALGTSEVLGKLYSVDGTFCGESVFNCADITTLPNSKSLVVSRESPSTDAEYCITDCYSDRFKLLNVNAELRISVLCGLFSISGSGAYLSRENSSRKSVTATLVASVRTQKESFQINNALLKPFYVTEVSDKKAASCVTEITWGGKASLTVTFENSKDESKEEVSGKLDGVLKWIAGEIKAGGSISANSDFSSISSEFKFRIVSDSRLEFTPTTVEQAVELMRNVLKELQTANQGKGIPVNYQLTPISQLQNVLKLETGIDVISNKISVGILADIEKFFDELEITNGCYEDLKKDIEGKLAKYIPDSAVTKFKSDYRKWQKFRLTSKVDIAEHVRLVRLQEREVTDLADLLTDVTEDIAEVAGRLNDYVEYQTKFLKLKVMLEKMFFIGKGDDWVTQCAGKHCFLLTFSYKLIQSQELRWNDNVSMIHQLAEENPTATLYLVDREFNSVGSESIAIIERNKKGELLSEDIVADRRKEQAYALIKPVDNIRPTLREFYPNDRIKCSFACCKTECGRQVSEWMCERCDSVVECSPLEINTNDAKKINFYCHCGELSCTDAVFRCCNLKHGKDFLPYPSSALVNVLRMMADNVIYILLVGQSGGGKSTFINSFANYLQGDTLEEVLNNGVDMVKLIKTKFCIPKGDGSSLNIALDAPEVIDDLGTNECDKPGQSSTQRCRTYSFAVGSKTIKLIDTPGLNDARGIDQDKKNLENIMAYLGYFKKIHAILYIVPSNLPILTNEFKFCFKQFVTKLHKSAAKNMIFVYTKSRSAFYTPGTTRALLSQMLEEVKSQSDVTISLAPRTEYCLDNEALQILVGAKHGITFTPEQINDFSGSWRAGATECKRMLNYITRELQPHEVNDTLSIHKVRKLLGQLAQPIAKITSSISQNIALYEARLAELKKTVSEAELQKLLYIDQTYVETQSLPGPRTICQHLQCYTKERTGDGTEYEVYLKICHDQCYVTPSYNIPNENIKQCACFAPAYSDDTPCTVCGHSWRTHRHIKETYTIKKKTIKSKAIADQENAVEVLRQETEELKLKEEGELKDIRNALANLAVFVAKNSIYQFDDTLDELIRKEIEQLSIGPQDEQTKSRIARLNEMMKVYEEEKQAFAAAATLTGEGVDSAEAAMRLIESLYNLPLHGSEIRQSINVQDVKYAYVETPCHVKPRRVKGWLESGYESVKSFFV